MTACRIFFDFDHTLYHTDALMARISAEIETLGFDRETIKRAQAAATKDGYSFARHLAYLGLPKTRIRGYCRAYRHVLEHGDAFLLPQVPEGLRELQNKAELHLLTYGRPSHQRHKVRGIKDLKGLFTAKHYVWRNKTKGDIIRQYGSQCLTFFLDDVSTHLEDACKKAPWTSCIRMQWPEFVHNPPEFNEPAWPVVHSFTEFLTLVERRL